MPFALLAALCLLAAASLILFWVHPWWLPVLASTQGGFIDHQFAVSYLWIGAIFFTAQFLLGLLVWRYRERTEAGAHFLRGDVRLEILWTTLTALLFLGLSWTGAEAWSKSFPASHGAAHHESSKVVEVEVNALQFAWYFHYPGRDGKLGRTRPELQDASGGSEAAIGLDGDDPAASDDIVSTVLVLPAQRDIQLRLRSQDVIHSFFVPELRFKQDTNPGNIEWARFTLERMGTYEIACAELCGTGHYKMRAELRVVSAEEYENWLTERLARKLRAEAR